MMQPEVIYVDGKAVGVLKAKTMERPGAEHLVPNDGRVRMMQVKGFTVTDPYTTLRDIARDEHVLSLIVSVSSALTRGMIERGDLRCEKLNTALQYASDRDENINETMTRLFLYREGYLMFGQQFELFLDDGYYQVLPFYLKLGERRICIQPWHKPVRRLRRLGFEVIRVTRVDIQRSERLRAKLDKFEIPRMTRDVSDEVYEMLSWEKEFADGC
jgi:hypothetical protein